MDTDNSNSTQQTERDRINEQLDELRQNQQERKPQKKTRSRWKRRLLGFLGVISGLFLLGTSCSKPTVTCYRHAEPEDEEEASENAPKPDSAPHPDSDSNLYDPELETLPDNSDGSDNADAD